MSEKQAIQKVESLPAEIQLFEWLASHLMRRPRSQKQLSQFWTGLRKAVPSRIPKRKTKPHEKPSHHNRSIGFHANYSA